MLHLALLLAACAVPTPEKVVAASALPTPVEKLTSVDEATLAHQKASECPSIWRRPHARRQQFRN